MTHTNFLSRISFPTLSPDNITNICSGVAISIGTTGLFGWILGIEELKSVFPNFPGTKANVSIGIVLASLSLFFNSPLPERAASQWIRRTGRLFSYLIIGLGFLTLLEYFIDIDLRIDQMFFTEPAGAVGTAFPNRMATATATNFLFSGLAILCLDKEFKNGIRPAQVLALLSALMPIHTLLCYLYGVRDVIGFGPFMLIGQMAIPTAAALLALSVGILFARPTAGFVALITKDGAAGLTVRSLLWPSLVLPPALGWMFIKGDFQKSALPGFSASILVLSCIVCFVVAIWGNARAVQELEDSKMKMDRALSKKEEDFKIMFNLATTGIAVAEIETARFLQVNKRLCEMTGYTHQELLNKTFLEITHPDDIDENRKKFKEKARSNQEIAYNKRYVRKDGSIIWVRISAITLSGSDSALAIIQDVTDQKNLENDLRKSKELAENASKLKSAFLANMSHEIRTPLGAILGFSNLLLEKDITSTEQQEFVSTIQRNGQSLVRLIDDILDLSKIEAGKIECEMEKVSLTELFDDMISIHKPLAKTNFVSLYFGIEGVIPELIMTDSMRLRQILINLIGNAIKFTRNGRVDVSVSRQSSSENSLGFIVKDTGLGISAEHREALFKPFSQGDSSTTRKYGGTGLGLVLSRRLAQTLGGTVELVESTPGVGSTFSASISYQPVADSPTIDTFIRANISAPALPTISRQLEGISILLAEDAIDNQILVKRMLTMSGAKVEVVSNGVDAVDLALANKFDVVLMDLQMPKLDGYEATAQLRRRGFNPPIIALTAHAMKEERERSREAGCNDHITKPINSKILVETIRRYTGSAPGLTPIPII